MATINTTEAVSNENKKIPLWKLVDANYDFGDTDEDVHHNGFLIKLASASWSLVSTPSYKIYEFSPVTFVYSSLTYALYRNDTLARLTVVTEFTAANQTMFYDGALRMTIAAGDTVPDYFISPSDFTRIDAGSQMAIGLKTFENVVPGAQYNNNVCIGYMYDVSTEGTNLYDDDGEIISPFFYDTTYTFAQVFGSYARGATRPVYGESRFLIRRIAMTEREVNTMRSRALSGSCFARMGDDNGSPIAGGWSIVHPLDVCTDFASVPLIECEFKSTPSGAYLFIKNHNAFDIFVYSMEIWGLWAKKQSETGEWGGAIYHASYDEHSTTKDNVVTIENPYVATQEQAEEVADYYLDLGTVKKFALSDVECPHARFLEIGDRFKAQIDDLGTQTGIFVVVSKTIKDDMHIISGRMIGTE